MINHNQQAASAMERLAGWGFSADTQQRVGALTVVWGLFETRLETVIWALSGEIVQGVTPSTDRLPISKLIDRMENLSVSLPIGSREILQGAATAARDLMEYRHTIMHGWLIPSAKMPTLIRNPGWNRSEEHTSELQSLRVSLLLEIGRASCRERVFRVV